MFILFLTAAFWVLIRLFAWEFPHSGYDDAPMFGDFEAQRHWVEITNNLPPSKWYHNGPDNNLTYWGLDYPPLSAFHAQFIGVATKYVFESGYLDDVLGFDSRKQWRRNNGGKKQSSSTNGASVIDNDIPTSTTASDDIVIDKSRQEIVGVVGSATEDDAGSNNGYYDDDTPQAAWNSLFGLHVSHGVQGPLVKVVMDIAVTISDVLCYVGPSVLLAKQLSKGDASSVAAVNNADAATASSSGSASFEVLLAVLLLLPISMTQIDYGHFQFNCVTLGLVVLGVWCIAKGEESAAKIVAGSKEAMLKPTSQSLFGSYLPPVGAAVCFFTAALFKITTLYAIPMFAFYCLGWCLFRPLSMDVMRRRLTVARLIKMADDDEREKKASAAGGKQKKTAAPAATDAKSKQKAADVATAAAVAAQAREGSVDLATNTAVPFPSVTGLFHTVFTMIPFVVALWFLFVGTFYLFLNDVPQVLHRMFPFARGLYEDKVANVWCCVSPVFKLPQIVGKVFANAIDAAVTDSLAKAAAQKAALEAMGELTKGYNSNGDDSSAGAALVGGTPESAYNTALVGKVAIICTIATALAFMAACIGVLKRMYKLRQVGGGAVAAAKANGPSTSNAAKKKKGADEVLPSPSPATSSEAAWEAHRRAHPTLAAHQTLFYVTMCGLAATLSFFLFSFQVHEKSILVSCCMAVVAVAVGIAAKVRPLLLVLLVDFILVAHLSLCQLATKDDNELLWYALWFLLVLATFPLGQMAALEDGGHWLIGSTPTLLSCGFYLLHSMVCPQFLDEKFERFPHLGVLVRMTFCCAVFVMTWLGATWVVLMAKDEAIFMASDAEQRQEDDEVKKEKVE